MTSANNTPHTAEQLQGFKTEYLARKRRQWIISGSAVILVIFALGVRHGFISNLQGLSKDDIGKGLLAVVAVMIILSWRNWRCPACSKYLGRSMGHRFCAKCGVALDG